LKSSVPESDLIRQSFTLRILDLPPEVKSTKRSLLRWFALSTGLISENESRLTVLDILDCLFYFNFSKKTKPNVLQLRSRLKEKFKTDVSEKLLRYHLNRLIDLKLIERKKNAYCFLNSPYASVSNVQASFDYHLIQPLNKRLGDISNVYQKIADSYK